MRPGRRRDCLHPAPTQLRRLGPQQQPTLPLVQMRAQDRVPASHGLRHLRTIGHSTPVERPESKTQIILSRVLSP